MREVSCGFFGILLTLSVIHLRGDIQFYHPTDADIIMPAYSNRALRNRIEGSVHFRVVFNQEKVESIVVLSSTLKMGAPPLRPDPDYQEPALVRRVQERLERTIAQWTTTFLDRKEYEVEIRLRIDDSLRSEQRSFHVEYGKDSVVRLIELRGPRIDFEKGVNSPEGK